MYDLNEWLILFRWEITFIVLKSTYRFDQKILIEKTNVCRGN